MPLDQLTPEVWAGSFLSEFHQNVVYAQEGVCNRDYEGEIANAGDVVHVQAIGRPTISNYTKNTNMSAAETLQDSDSTLVIDQQKSYNFYVDDIDAQQNKLNAAAEGLDLAAAAMAETVDAFMSALYTDISPTNSIGTDGAPITDSSTTLYARLVAMKVLLDKQNVPSEGRWAVLPPDFEGYLLLDARFVGSGTAPQDDRIRNAFIGRAAGFNIHISNLVPNTSGTKYKIIAGHPSAWSFAGNVQKIERFSPELRFGEGFKGLYVYGGKVFRPNALALMTANAS